VTASAEENVRLVAKAKGVRPEEIGVVILDRERHAEMISAVREVGARVFLISDGDVAGAIAAATARRSGIDLLLGIGGTPEGVISAAALKCLGGAIQGRLYPRNDEERRKLVEAGFDIDRVLTTDDLVAGRDVFFAATGITDGSCSGREVLARRRDHVLDGDALALGHGPDRRGRAPVRQARALLSDRVPPLTQPGGSA
jgi:fructose-1,6-bisphosphatase II